VLNKMSITIDPITRKKLILVKQLYQQTVAQFTSQNSIIGRIQSAIGFDLAVETVLRAVVGSLDAAKTPADGFQGLVQQCDTLLPVAGCNLVPDKANIQYIHSIRNDAQHKAKYPNEPDVSDCRTYCRDFLSKVITDVWGLDFERISLTDAIQDDKIKQLLIGAETALSQKDYQQAIHQAAAGLTLALNRVETAVVGSLSSFASAILVLDAFGQPLPDSDARSTFSTLERMQETLLFIALDLNYTGYMKYKQIAGQVNVYLNGNYDYQGSKENPDANDAEFTVSYCVDTVVQIENHVGSLQAPFGSNRWY
jgi:hypothetical protein